MKPFLPLLITLFVAYGRRYTDERKYPLTTGFSVLSGGAYGGAA